MRKNRKQIAQLLGAVAAVAGSMTATRAVHAQTDVWQATGDPMSSGTATGVLSYNNGTGGTALSYSVWNNSNSNFSPTYTGTLFSGGITQTPGDNVIFYDTTANGASASAITTATTIAVNSTAQTPNSISFSNASGGTAEFFTFLRANTSTSNTSTSSHAPGFADNFSSGSPFASNTSSVVYLNSGFLGTVDLQARAGGTKDFAVETPANLVNGFYQSAIITSGTLEIEDALALPGDPNGTTSVTNKPDIDLNGGQFIVNVTDGSYAPTGPGGSNLSGVLSVTADSQLTNGMATSNSQQGVQLNLYNGPVDISPGVTLTINTSGGVSSAMTFNSAPGVNTSGGTVSLGSSNGILRTTNTAGSTLNFNLGSGSGAYSAGGSSNGGGLFGSLIGGANTVLYGSTGAGSTSSTIDTETIGYLNSSSTFSGTIVNGAYVNGLNQSAGYVGSLASVLALRPVAVAKTGTGTTTAGGTPLTTLTLSGNNLYGGGTTVGNGTLQAGSSHAFSDSAAPITVNGTPTTSFLDYNGFSPAAGQAYTLNGGSLVNNGTATVTLATGASGSVSANSANGSQLIVGSGATVNVSVGSPNIAGGTQAYAMALLQLGSVSLANGNGGGSYYTEPSVNVSGGGLIPGGRPAVVIATVNTNVTTPFVPGPVTGFQVVDPGYGYTSVPTVTLSGGGGTGGAAVTVNGVIAGLLMTNGGTGYANYSSGSGPTFSVTSNGSSGTMLPTIVGNYGQINLTATSGIGGSGPLTVNPVISGGSGFVLTKVLGGVTTLNAANTYVGGTNVSAGTLLVNGVNAVTVGNTGTTGTGDVVVNGTSSASSSTFGTLGGTGTAGNTSTGAGAAYGTGVVTVNGYGVITAGASNTSTGTLTTGAESWNSSNGQYLAKVFDASNTSTGTGGNDRLVMSALTITPGTGEFSVNVNISGGALSALQGSPGAVLVLAYDKDTNGATNPFNTSGGAAPTTLSLEVNGDGNTGTTDSAASLMLATQSDTLNGSGWDLVLEDSTAAAPEPTSLLLAGVAAAPLALGRRRRRQRAGR
jgi:fibronectin-binding autotransporter adhesin